MLQNLPAPDRALLEHSRQVQEFITRRIQQQGPVTFACYMQDVLYAPALGYYVVGTEKFGAQGDFVTAPEISPLYSHCLARQIAQVLSSLKEASVLELGAGQGVMALEILKELERLENLPTHYFILEVSADLRQRQKKLLQQEMPHFIDRIQWLDTLPKNFIGVIVANEVIDAFPVHKIKRVGQQWQEYYVAVKDDQFYWQLGDLSQPEFINVLNAAELNFCDGYETEINSILPGWMAALSAALQQGMILLIDYGFPRHEYYHPDRHMGTIMCHYQHHAHSDPLIFPGIQDVTAHVDFTAVAEAAVQNDLNVDGFIHQAGFLMSCGITDMLDSALEPGALLQQNNAVKKLTLPSEMGELFKVMALTKDFDAPFLGFLLMNQVERL